MGLDSITRVGLFGGERGSSGTSGPVQPLTGLFVNGEG
jgi:hypothetical protein